MNILKEWPYLVLGIGGPKGTLSMACMNLESAIKAKRDFQDVGCTIVEIALVLEHWKQGENKDEPRSLFGPEVNQCHL